MSFFRKAMELARRQRIMSMTSRERTERALGIESA